MPKLQIWHHRDEELRRNYTVAVIQPFRAELEALERKLEAGEEAILTLSLGTAVLHPKEKEWVKKTGREVAKQNMKFEKYSLLFINKYPGETHYLFKQEDLRLRLLLSHGKNTAFIKSLDY